MRIVRNEVVFPGLLAVPLVSLVSWQSVVAQAGNAAERPNFVLIFTDDQGYGDLSCFGNQKIKTPHIDRLAAEGMRFTDFYSAASVCTPSRAALLTGCYPGRVGNLPVLFPTGDRGLHPDEQTIAELLREVGYRTGCFGKWHLGHLEPFLPTSQGFNEYFGIPYSNDMGIDPTMPLARDVNWREGATPEAFREGKVKGSPLMQGTRRDGCRVVECPADQRTLTRRYTEEAIRFIERANEAGEPFFVYLPHTMPHIPLYASDAFRGQSDAGLYGDTIEEIDASVGEIIGTLRQLQLDKNTLIIYTSDNGPWGLAGSEEAWVKGNMNRKVGGSAGPLRGYKFSTWEGGMREPTVMWSPGLIPAGKTCAHITSTIDILPTLVELADAPRPQKKIDGQSITRILKGGDDAAPVRNDYFYQTQGVRQGDWKLNNGQLFNLKTDIGESKNAAADHPDIVEALQRRLDDHRADLKENGRPAGEWVRPSERVQGLPHWKAIAGQWRLSDGILVNAATDGDSIALSKQLGLLDYVFEVKARKIAGAGGPLLLIRAKKTQYPYWSIGDTDGRQSLKWHGYRHARVKIDFDEPREAKMQDDRWYHLRIEANGSNIRCFINGELVTQGTIQWGHRGMIGVGAHQAVIQFKEPRLIVDDQNVLENWTINLR